MKSSHSLRGQAVILEPATTADNTIQPIVASVVPLVLQQQVGQTGDMLEIQDPVGAILGGFSSAGGLIAANGSFTGVVGGDPTTGKSFQFASATVTPSADSDYTLTAAEASKVILTIVAGAWTTGHSIIVPAGLAGAFYHISNSSGFTLTVKPAGGAGINIANARAATVRSNGVNMRRMTPDVDPTV